MVVDIDRLLFWKTTENVMESMVTGHRMMKMVQKVSLMEQLMSFQSGTQNDMHGQSEDSRVAACEEDEEKEKARVVVSEEDHDSDQ